MSKYTPCDKAIKYPVAANLKKSWHLLKRCQLLPEI